MRQSTGGVRDTVLELDPSSKSTSLTAPVAQVKVEITSKLDVSEEGQ